jgi:biopolymer transport protein ExbB/TolQ
LLRHAVWGTPVAVLLASSAAFAEGSGGAGSFSFLDAAKILLTHGGIFPYLNIGVSALAIAIIIERAVMLNKYSIRGEPFMKQLVKLVREGQVDRARKLCEAAPSSVLAKVLKSGLDSSNRGEAEISSALEESTLEVTPMVSKRIPSLFPLANIATLIGLIGTISGLIKCFAALSAASPAEKQTVLSRGISEAMYNTAFGLMIAVICIAAQLWLANKAKHVLEEVEFNAMKLENLLARRLAGDLESEKAA